MYLPHQQYQQQLQHQHQRRGIPQSHPLSQGHTSKSCHRGPSGEPETITLSDDDDMQNSHISTPHNDSGSSTHVKAKKCDDKEQNSRLVEKDIVLPENCKEPTNSIGQNVSVSNLSVTEHNMKIETPSNSVENRPRRDFNFDKSLNKLNPPLSHVSDNNIIPAKIKTERLSLINMSVNASNVNQSISSKDILSYNDHSNIPKCESSQCDDYESLHGFIPHTSTQMDISTHYLERMKREKESRQFSKDVLKKEEGACNELPSFETTSNANILCAMTLLQFAESGFEGHSAFNFESDPPLVLNSEGLDILLAGIEIRTFEEMELLRDSTIGIDMLCSVTRQDCYRLGLGDSCYQLGLDALCDITKNDYLQFLYWIDPIFLLKQQFRIREYRSEARAMMCRNFIADRISAKKEETLLTLDENFQCPNAKIKSLDQVIRKIKNTEIMSQLEVSLREQICDLQNIYSDKQKEVSRLKLTPKKVKKLKTKRQRGPGRPKKRCLKSTKSKMGRPRKTRGSCESNDTAKEDRMEHLDDIYVEEDVEMRKIQDDHHLLPPILEPFKSNSSKLKNRRKSSDSPPPPPLTPMMDTFGNFGSNVTPTTAIPPISNLLRPPKLTANSSPTQQGTSKTVFTKNNRSSVTNLSTINEKFMKGKANPFANLLTKLATKPNVQNENEDDNDVEVTSQSDADEDDKVEVDKVEEDKVSQTDEGEESDKPEQDAESTTTEEEEYAPRPKRNNRQSINDVKSGEQEGKQGSSKQSNAEHNSQILGNKSSVVIRGASKKVNGKQSIPLQEHQDTTEHSSEQNVSSDFEDSYSSSAQKKRKSDKPKKHFGSTNEVETIVPKKPKNLFMMNCLKMQQNQRELKHPNGVSKPQMKKDEYDFTDEDEDHDIIKIGKHRKTENTAGTSVSNTMPSSPPPLPPASDIASPSKNFTECNEGSTTSATHPQSRQQPSASSSPMKERGVSSKLPPRPKSAASNSSVTSVKNQSQSSVRIIKQMSVFNIIKTIF